eukprot:Rmarinus@m.8973
MHPETRRRNIPRALLHRRDRLIRHPGVTTGSIPNERIFSSVWAHTQSLVKRCRQLVAGTLADSKIRRHGKGHESVRSGNKNDYGGSGRGEHMTGSLRQQSAYKMTPMPPTWMHPCHLLSTTTLARRRKTLKTPWHASQIRQDKDHKKGSPRRVRPWEAGLCLAMRIGALVGEVRMGGKAVTPTQRVTHTCNLASKKSWRYSTPR